MDEGGDGEAGAGRTRRRVVVRGRVQMVGFRLFAQRLASQHGVGGWVRNTPDGGVEAVVEGAPPAVREVVRRLAEGPAAAEVTAIEEGELPIDQPVHGFRVLG